MFSVVDRNVPGAHFLVNGQGAGRKKTSKASSHGLKIIDEVTCIKMIDSWKSTGIPPVLPVSSVKPAIDQPRVSILEAAMETDLQPSIAKGDIIMTQDISADTAVHSPRSIRR